MTFDEKRLLEECSELRALLVCRTKERDEALARAEKAEADVARLREELESIATRPSDVCCPTGWRSMGAAKEET